MGQGITGLRPIIRWRLDHFGHSVVAGDEARAAASGEVEPSPFDKHDQLPAKVDQEQDVNQGPHQESEVAAKPELADFGDSAVPTDDRHGASVVIVKGL